MINQSKKNILGVGVDAIDYESAVEKTINAAKNSQSFSVSASAVHSIMTGFLNKNHRYRLNKLNLIVPDGQPVRWALNLLHKAKLKDRVYGPTLTLKLCEAAEKQNLPIYLYGSKSEVLDKLQTNLKRQFPNLKIAGAEPSKFRKISQEEKQQVIKRIKDSGAKIIFVALGCPRQEVWAYEYQNYLNMPIIAVGAAFDFHAKLLDQAPPLLQKMGLEWLFRLIKEPKRLWKRYLFLNPLYLFLIFLQFVGVKFKDEDLPEPEEELNFG